MGNDLNANMIQATMDQCLASAIANGRPAGADWKLGTATLDITINLPMGPPTSRTIKVEALFGPSGSTEEIVVPYKPFGNKADFTQAARTLLRGFLRQAR